MDPYHVKFIRLALILFENFSIPHFHIRAMVDINYIFLSFQLPALPALPALHCKAKHKIIWILQNLFARRAIYLSASIPSPSPSPHGLNLILLGRGMEAPSSRSQLRPAPGPRPISNQGMAGGFLDAAG